MKKKFNLMFCLLLGLSSISCKNNSNPNSQLSSITDIETAEDIGFTIHFDIKSKVDDKYKYNLWMWPKGGEGKDYQFNGEDSFGIYAKYKFEEIDVNLVNKGLGFIVKENKIWADSPSKDYALDRYIDFSMYNKDKYGYYHVYLKSGDENMYYNDKLEVNDAITHYSFAYNEKTDILSIWFQTNHEFSNFTIKEGDKTIISNESILNDSNVISKSNKRIQYKLVNFPDIKKDYTLTVKFKDSGKELTKIAFKNPLFKTTKFNQLYNFDGQLGAIYSKEKTTFNVWSPVSTDIKLRIYDNGTPTSVNSTIGDDTYKEYQMNETDKGVFTVDVNSDLAGKYYTYVVTNSNYSNLEIVDPYAKSAGVNGLRGMIVDFSKTNPTGWDNVAVHDYDVQNLTVYETHIADLTSSTTWNGNNDDAKKFTGFYQENTSYTENGVTVKTGFDHIKELGVNAVQLLPIFDQANDEVNIKFNWGYNPLNYNVIEGAYSKNPYDGYERIKEFKNLIAAYNKAGINIIMDVVYNHVNSLEKSNFDVLMPGYYFRYNSGVAKNGSGCGNETASEMYMYRKFMIDSTEFLASEYKLGGFRFDLMGVHDIETMNQLSNNLHTKVNQNIAIYGEPWSAESVSIDSELPANQSNLDKYEGYGCFNDKLRDALIKGGLSKPSEKGWITDNKKVDLKNVTDIANGIVGNILGKTNYDPKKCINYVTCHDNYTLYDRIVAAGIKDETIIKKMATLANSIVFTSQGTSFMLSGDEFLRSKGGNNNSYEASYKVNELDYSLKIKNLDVFNNYKKLISLKQNKALFAKDALSLKDIKVNSNNDSSLIYFDLTDTVNKKQYRIVYSNGVSSTKVINLEGYNLHLDTLNKSHFTLSSNTTIDNYQTIIAYKNI